MRPMPDDELVVISRRGAKHLADLVGTDRQTADQARQILANALAKQRRALAARVRDEAYAGRRSNAGVNGEGTYEGGMLRAARIVEGGQRREDQATSLLRAARRLHLVIDDGPDGEICEHCTSLAGAPVAAPCETLKVLAGGRSGGGA